MFTIKDFFSNFDFSSLLYNCESFSREHFDNSEGWYNLLHRFLERIIVSHGGKFKTKTLDSI